MGYVEEMSKREVRAARFNYLCSPLPEELRRDATVAAIANQCASQDDFTVEGCLVEMVRALAKGCEQLRAEYLRRLEVMLPPATP